jgi:hypothetical protein
MSKKRVLMVIAAVTLGIAGGRFPRLRPGAKTTTVLMLAELKSVRSDNGLVLRRPNILLGMLL